MPLLPVAPAKADVVGVPMPPKLRARLTAAGLLIKKDALCFKV